MFDPNNPLLKIVFLVGSWLMIFVFSSESIKSIAQSFNESKTLGKFFKLIGASMFILLLFIMTLICVDRLMNFSAWQIGGPN
jgi:hypothetical protein